MTQAVRCSGKSSDQVRARLCTPGAGNRRGGQRPVSGQRVPSEQGPRRHTLTHLLRWTVGNRRFQGSSTGRGRGRLRSRGLDRRSAFHCLSRSMVCRCIDDQAISVDGYRVVKSDGDDHDSRVGAVVGRANIGHGSARVLVSGDCRYSRSSMARGERVSQMRPR
ncbi:hypothetical protein ANO11243_009750 [Dothideomycetidae sp. 11243]|nr:hypothetical protein ANO11243_009750 [fungal sp. No.11243]